MVKLPLKEHFPKDENATILKLETINLTTSYLSTWEYQEVGGD